MNDTHVPVEHFVAWFSVWRPRYVGWQCAEWGSGPCRHCWCPEGTVGRSQADPASLEASWNVTIVKNVCWVRFWAVSPLLMSLGDGGPDTGWSSFSWSILKYYNSVSHDRSLDIHWLTTSGLWSNSAWWRNSARALLSSTFAFCSTVTSLVKYDVKHIASKLNWRHNAIFAKGEKRCTKPINAWSFEYYARELCFPKQHYESIVHVPSNQAFTGK